MPTDDVHLLTASELWFRIIVLVAFALFTWWIFKPDYAFFIRLSPSGVKLKKGLATTAFLAQLDSTRKDFQLASGWVGCVGSGPAMRFKFSRNIPLEFRQRVRNLWLIYK